MKHYVKSNYSKLIGYVIEEDYDSLHPSSWVNINAIINPFGKLVNILDQYYLPKCDLSLLTKDEIYTLNKLLIFQ